MLCLKYSKDVNHVDGYTLSMELCGRNKVTMKIMSTVKERLL